MNDGLLASIIIMIGYSFTVVIILIKEIIRAKRTGTAPRKLQIFLFVLWILICGSYAVYKFLNQ